MSIRHQIPKHLTEQFLADSSEIIPEVPLEIVKEGNFYSTVDFRTETPEDEVNVLIFINTFNQLNK